MRGGRQPQLHGDIATGRAKTGTQAEHGVKDRHGRTRHARLDFRRPTVHGDIHRTMHRPKDEQRHPQQNDRWRQRQRHQGRAINDGTQHRHPRSTQPFAETAGKRERGDGTAGQAQKQETKRRLRERELLLEAGDARGPDAEQKAVQGKRSRNRAPAAVRPKGARGLANRLVRHNAPTSPGPAGRGDILKLPQYGMTCPNPPKASISRQGRHQKKAPAQGGRKS